MDSIGSIKDSKIRIQPSHKLIDFISKLESSELTENIFAIKAFTQTTLPKCTIVECKDYDNINITVDDVEAIKSVRKSFLHANEPSVDERDLGVKLENIDNKANDPKVKKDLCLTLIDLRWLFDHIVEYNKVSDNKIYLHELLEDSALVLPQNEVIKRNPVLEARCKKLRAQQQARDYRDMTRNVDNQRKFEPQETIAYQISQMNRQMIAILQFIFSVAAGFVFGFIGLELMFGELDFGFRLLMGIIFSLIIAIAEIYFLAKKLNEEEVIITVPIQSNVSEIPENPDENKLVDEVKNPPHKKKTKLDKKID